jgi:tetratricopeptide (TPR) repeat protein
VNAPPSDNDINSLSLLAERALEAGEEAQAIPAVRAGAERHASALLWQWTGLLERSLDRHEEALAALDQAARIAPQDVRIAHARAQVAMEAGLPAVGLFEDARGLAPNDGALLVGLAAARTACGEGERGASDLADMLEKQPTWIFGHEQYAQLMSTLGHPDRVTETLERAIARMPRNPALWDALLRIELKRGAYASIEEVLRRARQAGAHSSAFPFFDAVRAAETDSAIYPSPLFADAPPSMDVALCLWRVRHLLRVGAADAALPLIHHGLSGATAAEIWPYAATAWRVTGDPRCDWLEADSSLVQAIDLRAALPPLDELAETLRKLHVAKGEYLDQSVRGGTQTDGPLLSRVDPIIRHLRSAIVTAVRGYLNALPPADPRHPLLRHRRDRVVRFAGSWSVQLRSGGRHSNHVHPQGWISSALYVALPPRRPGDPDDAGWLTLGAPAEDLGLGLEPTQKVEPKPGRLVLFPSWMWHGTVPFAEGGRLTVAFDVRPPV